MKIAIIGTRGIPNHYGGFEQLAEYLSVGLLSKGHEVYVYNSSLHPYQEKQFKGVSLIHCNDPEDRLGTAGQFIYDFNCIRHARKQKYDIILQLGYTSSSVWSFMFPEGTAILTNMDGLEWKRSKYNKPTQWFLKQAEKWAVKYSHALIADSPGIQEYLKNNYNKSATFIPYGADIPVISGTEALTARGLQAQQYYMILARMEPENNIETIIQGYLAAGSPYPLLIIGNTGNAFGRHLKQTYNQNGLIFSDPEYDILKLNQLRKNALIYFHGHSVGGTNPSLLEAMASSAFICAHQNIFNQYILGQDALWFSNSNDIATLLKLSANKAFREKAILENLKKVSNLYSWELIYESYLNVMLDLCQ